MLLAFLNPSPANISADLLSLIRAREEMSGSLSAEATRLRGPFRCQMRPLRSAGGSRNIGSGRQVAPVLPLRQLEREPNIILFSEFADLRSRQSHCLFGIK